MKAILGKRSNPAIVLGDFNSSWQEGEHEIQALARVRQLKTHRPEANFLYTYADERFDWILVSEDFDFCNYYTAPDILSDHLAVVGEIVLLPDASRLADCSVL
jgi:endonuclease/exonuclease/phosphatase family metal-dependent hydrolase